MRHLLVEINFVLLYFVWLFQLESQNGRIRVQAPQLTKSSCLIQLDDQMTAGDIVDRFRRDYGSNVTANRYREG